jgi:predicted  nucleic acid-binding Zn-ribbon protein
MEQVMSTYLTESEINNYNYFVDIHKAATSDADKALMRTAYTLLNNAELKTNLETEIASTTKQIARLITEHNDIRFYTEEDKTMLKTELNKLQGTSKSLAAQALKMIDKITVQQNTITATSGNPHSMPSQGGNNNPEVKLDIRSMSNNNQQSKLHSKLVATDVTKAYAYTDNPLQRKDSSLSSQGGKQK